MLNFSESAMSNNVMFIVKSCHSIIGIIVFSSVRILRMLLIFFHICYFINKKFTYIYGLNIYSEIFF